MDKERIAENRYKFNSKGTYSSHDFFHLSSKSSKCWKLCPVGLCSVGGCVMPATVLNKLRVEASVDDQGEGGSIGAV